MLDALSGLLGTALAVAGTILVVLGGRLILKRAVKDKRTLPYYGQFYTVLLCLVGLFIAIALLPLPAGIRSQMLSVLGILLSAVVALSATNLVGNAMAGIMLRLMKGFRPGDFIRFDSWIGRVTDIGLFHTEMQLVTRDIVTVPNSLLAQKAVRVTRRAGTFVSATLSIGYTEGHTAVEEALKEAAEACGLSEPFVFVEELMDFSIRYKLYGLLEEPSELMSKRSQLLKSVLDTLHRHGIEIMSPTIVDRRAHGADYRYIPEEPAAEPEQEEREKIEDIAFDRAEQAESIEELYAEQEKLNRRLEHAGEPDTEEGEAPSAEQVRARKSTIKRQLDQIQAEIEKRESEKEEQRLDESAPE